MRHVPARPCWTKQVQSAGRAAFTRTASCRPRGNTPREFKSASSRLISSIALSRLHLPPDLYKCGGKPFAFIDNAMRHELAICAYAVAFVWEAEPEGGAE